MGSMADDALVLDSHPYRDRHLLLDVLTRRHGALRGVLRGARTGKSPQGGATQVLSLIRLSAFQSSRAELATFKQVQLVTSSFPLSTSFAGASAAAVVAELLAAFCPPSEPSELHFRLGTAALDALLSETDPDTVVAYSQLWVLVLGGVLPPLTRCAACGARLEDSVAVRATDGHALCRTCASTDCDQLDDAALDFLLACRRDSPSRVAASVPPAVGRWLDHLTRLEAHRSLKALDFFRRYRE
jgi:DNA repair protein RecO